MRQMPQPHAATSTAVASKGHTALSDEFIERHADREHQAADEVTPPTSAICTSGKGSWEPKGNRRARSNG